MGMYFKVRKDSETGEKFNSLLQKAAECKKKARILADEIGFTDWYGKINCAYGGISSVIFKEAPDRNIWKKIGGGYFPKVAQKELSQMFNDLPTVRDKELNGVMNFNSIVARIGFNPNCGNFHLVVIPTEVIDASNFIAPTGCKEITISEYNQIKAEKE
jgi:hypothetical protein